eukprot:CAMPEP_0174916750 /NCGR_PEP_ID=MMETSP1355-20121228/2025_1 /TAXON_ID=464990 /ORGANISM="Hemiselmis tepida, Strain CCMP443" /LENGTH=168 /DNA_ID=CAMNT_0016161785 /DNA_START=163 /DNA_END=670 /DNA_ORIENTATION=-
MFSEAEKLARSGSDKAAGQQTTTKLAGLDGLMQPAVASQDAIKLGIPGALADAWAEANKDSLARTAYEKQGPYACLGRGQIRARGGAPRRVSVAMVTRAGGGGAGTRAWRCARVRGAKGCDWVGGARVATPSMVRAPVVGSRRVDKQKLMGLGAHVDMCLLGALGAGQ